MNRSEWVANRGMSYAARDIARIRANVERAIPLRKRRKDRQRERIARVLYLFLSAALPFAVFAIATN